MMYGALAAALVFAAAVLLNPYTIWRSPWKTLARRYRTRAPLPKRRLRPSLFICLDGADSNAADLRLYPAPEGLYLAAAPIGPRWERLSPTLCVPWKDISFQRSRAERGFRTELFLIGDPASPVVLEVNELLGKQLSACLADPSRRQGPPTHEVGPEDWRKAALGASLVSAVVMFFTAAPARYGGPSRFNDWLNGRMSLWAFAWPVLAFGAVCAVLVFLLLLDGLRREKS